MARGLALCGRVVVIAAGVLAGAPVALASAVAEVDEDRAVAPVASVGGPAASAGAEVDEDRAVAAAASVGGQVDEDRAVATGGRAVEDWDEPGDPETASPPSATDPADALKTPFSLRGHDFILPARLDHPFVVRQFALRQGVGYVAVPNVMVQGYDAPFTLALAGIVETLRLDGALLPWLGVFGEVGGQLSAGANADSAFFQGARGGASWQIGAVARLVRDPDRRIQVGTRAFVAGDHGFGLQPGTLVQAVVADREGTIAEILDGQLARYLLTRDRALLSGASLSAAFPLSRRVGLITSARSSAGSKRVVSFDGQSDVVARLPIATVSVGAAVDFDLAPFPLQLQTETRFRHEAEVGRERTLDGPLGSNVFGGIGAFYGGRRDVQLGLKLASLLRFGPDEGERWLFGELVIRVFL